MNPLVRLKTKPPSVGGTKILKDTTTTILSTERTSLGSQNGKIGFFGKSTVKQSLSSYTLSSVVEITNNYGLTNIPWIQQGQKLIGTGAIGNAEQGYSVSLSSDGNTLAIGGPNDDSFFGAVWIYTRTSGLWSQQGPKIVWNDAIGNSYQGYSVSLSSDGNTLAVGASDDNSGIGATIIFTRTSGVWTQQGPKLIGTGAVGTAYQGVSVSLSSDGNTLAAAGYYDDNQIGSVWIFTRTAGVWTQQGSKLTPTDNIGNSRFGRCVSLSADGNTMVAGGYRDDNFNGALWVFTRTSGIWTQQTKLLGTGAIGDAYQGYTVSISKDGNTIASGGYEDDSAIGATWIFIKTLGVWTQQGQKIIPSDAIGNAGFGSSVSLSDDGNVLASSAYNDNDEIGATWIFNRVNNVWVQISKLVGTGYVDFPSQGYDQQTIALSSDGKTLAVGGPLDDDNVGSTWIFVNN